MDLRKKLVIISAGLLVLVLAACAPAPAPLPETGEEATSTPEQQEPPAETEALPPQAVLEAQAWLAEQLALPVDQVEIIDMQQEEWTDSCLGLGQANESCAAVITPGWRATFEAGGQEYEVRTDETGEAIRSPQFTSEVEGEDPLVGTQWELVSFGPEGEEEPVIGQAVPTLLFQLNGQAFGSGGCNSYNTQYQVSDQLSFSEVVSTRMACEAEAGIMDQEQRFFEALQAAGEFEIRGDELVIRYDEGQGVLNFERITDDTDTAGGDLPLAGTQWTLQSFSIEGEEEPVIAGSNLTLSFQESGEAGGDGGCNTFGGTYEVQEEMLSFNNMVSTLRACTDESLNEQEARYLAALQSAGAYELQDDSLIIHYDDGQGTLTFTRSAAGGE